MEENMINESSSLDLEIAYDDLRDVFGYNLCSYGDLTKMVKSLGIVINEDETVDVVLTFIRPRDKQLYLNIIITGCNAEVDEYFDNYFFTWYDNRPFDVSTLNGQPLTKDNIDNLLKILEKANFSFKSEPNDVMPLWEKDYCESYVIKNNQ